MPSLFEQLRPHQWAKNSLVFLPVLTSHQFDAGTLIACFWAFVAFCALASGVYAFNDILDLQADRAHPTKRMRPLASGRIPLGAGKALGIILVCAGFALSYRMGPGFIAVMAVYFVTSSAYSFRLKETPVLDIIILALLYTVRPIAGSVATGIVMSEWLLAFSLFLFFSLAATKRLIELARVRNREMDHVMRRGYEVEDKEVLSQMAVASGYISVLVMALYLNSTAVGAVYSDPRWLWGICGIIFFWISRVVLLANKGGVDDDPVVFALRDRVSIACGVLVLVLTATASL